MGKIISETEAIQIVAEMLEVMRQHGVDVDTPYVFENFMQDHGESEILALILCGDGKEDGDGDYDEYNQKPVKDRIARYLPKRDKEISNEHE
jgi:hypothetical protein